MESTELINNIGYSSNTFSFNLASLLIIPLVFALLGTIIFSALLFLRIRILADTFKTPQNKTVRKIISAHMVIVVVATLLSLLFVIIA